MPIEIANPDYTNTVGTPIEDFNAAPAQQERPDTCNIHSQQQVMAMFGINVTETDLVNEAIVHGEYAPLGYKGTNTVFHSGNLLERHGIDVHRRINATIDDLISELSQGHKIIVSVDADEIWAEDEKSLSAEYIKDVISPESNHAVVVVGVDTVTGDVDIVDPGDGNLKRISHDVFVNAWEDSHFFMMSTTQSPQEYISQVLNNKEEVTFMSDPKNNSNLVQAYEEKVDATLSDQEVSSYDTYVLQTNQNGNPEVVGVDVDGDGKIDLIEIDHNADGKPDVVAMDVDGNGVADVYLLDTNSDGEPDGIGIDYDGDGNIDDFTLID